MPCDGASLFTFESAAIPEGVLHLDRDGGVLVSCDSLQNWAEPDEYFDEASTKRMTELGFIRPANIGPGWKMAAKPAASDFARLRQLSFQHLLPGHGKPLRDEAHTQFGATFDRDFPQ